MLKAIDYFCGGGGMSLGLQKAGIRVLAGIDNDERVKATYTFNHPDSKFILRDISSIEPRFLAAELNLKTRDDDLLMVGCSPCQYWSLLNTDKSKSKQTAFLLEFFQKHVEFFLPGYVLIENVPGLNSRNESPLLKFKAFLNSLGYKFDDGVINCNDYDVPQKRMRYVLLASRLGTVTLPPPSKKARLVLRDAIGDNKTLNPIPAGHIDHTGNYHSSTKLSAINLKRIQATPHDGGNRLAWKNNSELQLNAYKGKDDYFRDVYARLFWNKPAPTITTKFISYSNGRFGHPTQDRALSVREGAKLQSFPNNYKILAKSILDAARIIGNAVPPNMACALGKQLLRTHNGKC
ncbi:MAG TPA: DNA (cytosine-5-)-methyltransferase [Cellvibrio sp.]|nr:DNA (cytosine-5-)-methyltransferase [Cellvibrio sp.]